jgi:hypothetical protein
MEFEKIKKIVNGLVKSEYSHCIESFGEDADKTDNDEEYIKAKREESDLAEELMRSLSEDKKYIVDKYYNAVKNVSAFEEEYYFRKGVRSGLINLKFLNDIQEEFAIKIIL